MRRATLRWLNRATAFDVEGPERPPEVLALAQDSEPAEARQEPFETEFLEQPTVVGHGPAPFEVVVAAHGVALAPKATGHPVFALDNIGHGPRLGDTQTLTSAASYESTPSWDHESGDGVSQ